MTKTKTVFLYLIIAFLIAGCTEQKEKTNFPNILFVFADDMGYGDLSCYNPESKIATINIDALAAEGMRFTDAHSPAAVCVPSRYALITGQYAFRSSRKYEEGLISPGQTTIASVLKKAGYQTACIGKWHQGIVGEKDPQSDTDLTGGPTDHGFDEFFGMPASLDIPPYYYIHNKRPVALPTDTIAAREGTAPAEGKRKIQGPFYRAGKIAPEFKHEEVLDRFSQEAVQYLKDKAEENKNAPFFLYLALPAPHTPWLPAPAYRGKSHAGDYGDFVLQVDDLVGKLTKTLAETGMADNTLVIFSSDNGPVWYPENVAQYQHNSTGELSGMKGDALEGGHRLPFIARWKGNIEAGAVNHNLVCFTDLLATFAELTKIRLSEMEQQDSKSILPQLLNKSHPPVRNAFVMKSSKKIYSIRKGDWKLILGKGSGGFSDAYDPTLAEKNPFEGHLYRLDDDISESHNLYAKEPEKVEELKLELEKILHPEK